VAKHRLRDKIETGSSATMKTTLDALAQILEMP
jgi:hypothetical protein